MNVYYRKLYALLHSSERANEESVIWQQLSDLTSHKAEAERVSKGWKDLKDNNLPQKIASSSDRVNLANRSINISTVKHPISGQDRRITPDYSIPKIPQKIIEETNIEKLFWWFWRFYPELIRQEYNDFFLYPAHNILPDCPLHSYKSTVSALVGAMYPEGWQPEKQHERPHLLLFTFSPVQEFIKASRKFVDFWAGSYLLHYLSAKLCWYIAETYGPDSVITPSLWGQEIIDALIVQKYSDFAAHFACLQDGRDPVVRFNEKISTSLSTAGFPNIIVALVPGKEKASELGDKLGEHLKTIWTEIGFKVRDKIREQVIETLKTDEDLIWDEIKADFPKESQPIYKQELKKWLHKANWEWNKLWQMQLVNTWETYWTVIPLGNPDEELSIQRINQGWLDKQQELSQSRQSIPTKAERELYKYFNVGTWWGSLQNRLGQSIQAVKNTRNWRIPPAPGERSTLSGQFSAVHPNLLYNSKFQEGGGLPLSSLRLFWRVMGKTKDFSNLFNGSERLNAIELTKRMAWRYGGVAKDLGINVEIEDETNYENLIRFPNLSSIASARFAYNHPKIVQKYWNNLNKRIGDYDRFRSLTCRPFQIPKTDRELNPNKVKGQDYNGVMFSSKWLADDLGLQNDKEIQALREAIAATQKDCGFGDSSPADWWVIVVGDGDSMGQYVSGSKLKNYKDYLIEKAIAKPTEAEEKTTFEEQLEQLKTTKKRMGPATHVGLNRALLDFSNRLVPYLTEKRCCGRVIYSGGDDVLVVLPLEDLPLFLRSLRACWSGNKDPLNEFKGGEGEGGYWTPTEKVSEEDLVPRPYFTMGVDATMSLGIVVAHKSIPLPTVLETLWEAESERAKKLLGAGNPQEANFIPAKDGLCFRVIYGSGNVLEALMKGHLLETWCNLVENCGSKEDFSPLLYRLAEELPRRCAVTENTHLFREAAKVIISRREESKKLETGQENNLLNWLDAWENWAYRANLDKKREKPVLGILPDDLGYLLRFTAFWVDRLAEREKWGEEENQ